jgi:hypothetical protein
MARDSQYEPAQDPIIRSQGLQEGIAQFVIMAGAAGLCYWFAGFEIALLVVSVLGFSLTTMNVNAAATSTNVQIAEIRNKIDYLQGGR